MNFNKLQKLIIFFTDRKSLDLQKSKETAY